MRAKVSRLDLQARAGAVAVQTPFGFLLILMAKTERRCSPDHILLASAFREQCMPWVAAERRPSKALLL